MEMTLPVQRGNTYWSVPCYCILKQAHFPRIYFPP